MTFRPYAGKVRMPDDSFLDIAQLPDGYVLSRKGTEIVATLIGQDKLNLSTPVNAADAATKAYVDSLVSSSNTDNTDAVAAERTARIAADTNLAGRHGFGDDPSERLRRIGSMDEDVEFPAADFVVVAQRPVGGLRIRDIPSAAYVDGLQEEERYYPDDRGNRPEYQRGLHPRELEQVGELSGWTGQILALLLAKVL
jgi:hypothetical protein